MVEIIATGKSFLPAPTPTLGPGTMQKGKLRLRHEKPIMGMHTGPKFTAACTY